MSDYGNLKFEHETDGKNIKSYIEKGEDGYDIFEVEVDYDVDLSGEYEVGITFQFGIRNGLSLHNRQLTDKYRLIDIIHTSENP